MAIFTLHLKKAELNGVGVKEARRKVNRVVRRTFNRSQVLVPVDNGYLRASGKPNLARVNGLLVLGSVEYTADYAAAVHNGRRALTIRAKAGKRLRFVVDGEVVYAKSVHQPARAGRPFLAAALAEAAGAEGFRLVIG